VQEDLQIIRRMISIGGLLHARMYADRATWSMLCDGLDGITDASSPALRVAALNTVRSIAGLDSLDPSDADGAVLAAGVAAVRAEFEDQANRMRRAFAESPLRQHLHESDPYLIGKVAEAALGLLPEHEHHREGDTAVGNAAIVTLIGKLTAIRDGIAERDYDEWTRSDAEEALYILESVQALLQGEPVMPPRAAHLLVAHALPKLYESVRSLVAEIDEHFAQPDDGWGAGS
jgi:hypothetical protein